MADEKPKIASYIKINPGKSMLVKITHDTRISGKHAGIGTVAEVTEEVGFELIIAGKAERYTA